ncbi:hypothetical protein Ancab_024479 [Ancistrocladus abbreviatus]
MMISRFLLLLVSITLWVTMSMSQQAQNIALSGCKDECGNVSIPYPFGIGAHCAHDSWYEIVCNASFHPSKPFLCRLNLEVTEILSLERIPPTITVSIPPLNICTTGVSDLASSIDLRGSPYCFDSFFNVFVVEGCSGSVVLMTRSKEILAGYATSCHKKSTSTTHKCYGAGCCQTPIQKDLDFYQIGFYKEADSSYTCMTAGLSVQSFKRLSSADPFPAKPVAMLEDLSITSPSYQNALCFRHPDALDELPTGVNTQGYRCECHYTYEGNPYLPNGCRVVKGCEKCAGSKNYCIMGENGENHCKKKLWVTLAPVLEIEMRGQLSRNSRHCNSCS